MGPGADEKFEKWELKNVGSPVTLSKRWPPGIENHREVFFCGIQSEAEVHMTCSPIRQPLDLVILLNGSSETYLKSSILLHFMIALQICVRESFTTRGTDQILKRIVKKVWFERIVNYNTELLLQSQTNPLKQWLFQQTNDFSRKLSPLRIEMGM